MAFANELMNPSLVQGITCVVFDCDGVLIDSYESNMRYYGMIKEELDLPPLTPEEKLFVHTRTHADALEFIVPKSLHDAAWKISKAFDSTSLFPYLKRSDGVYEFLWWLRDAGFKLAINTSRSDTMDAILDLMDFKGFFFPIITSDKVAVPKPHPEGMFKIMTTLDVSPQQVAYIGDSHVDEKTAVASGVRFWAYGDTSLEAQIHIESFWDIKAAMQRSYKGSGASY